MTLYFLVSKQMYNFIPKRQNQKNTVYTRNHQSIQLHRAGQSDGAESLPVGKALRGTIFG
jgi:hypothetical protein